MTLDPSQWTSFEDFEAFVCGLPSKPSKAKGDAFEAFAEAYLVLTPELEIAEVWARLTVPDDVLDALGLTREDIGVDLFARRRDGTLWAIQAKFRSNRSAVTWKELSTFIGAGQRAEFRLLFANSCELPRHQPTYLKQQGFGSVLVADLLALGPEFFARWAQFARDRRPVPPERFKPREDQLEAIDAITRCFCEGADRLQLIAACGAGKTLTALWIAEGIGAMRVMVFCPSLSLVHQTLKSWAEQGSAPLEMLAVCSDRSVGDVKPSELPVPVTNSPEQARTFWATGTSTMKVLLATYQSLDVVRRGVAGCEPADLLIADEAHRLAGREGKAFQGVLDGSAIPAKRRLCMTATPRVLAQRYRGEDGDADAFVSMDDESVFGPVAYTLTFGQAIQLKLLADYQIDVLGVTDVAVRNHVKHRMMVDVAQGRIDAEMLAQAVALDRAMNEGVLRYAFTFHHRKDSALAFADILTTLHKGVSGPIPRIGVVLGEMSVRKRTTTLAQMLTAPTGVVCSAKALTEGVDAPAVDAVVFVDPKRSVVDIAQAVGRALRRDKRNPEKRAHIVVPVVVADGDDPERELERSSWESVWRVLQAMRAHDEVLAAEIDASLKALGERRARPVANSDEGAEAALGGKLVLWFTPDIDLARFKTSISLRAVQRAGDGFWEQYGRLLAYKAEHGDCLVPSTLEAEALVNFVNKQRALNRAGKLLSYRRTALEQIGFSWEPRQEGHESYLERIGRWVQDNKTGRVPNVLAEDSDLAHAVQNYRSKWRRGTLEDAIAGELRSKGFVFSLEDDAWHTMCRGIAESLALKTPLTAKQDNWLNYQQTRWRRGVGIEDGQLRPERAEALQRLGFGPQRRLDASHTERGRRTQQRCSELETFYAAYGHAEVPVGSHPALYRWLHPQLRRLKAGKQVPERVMRTLRAVGLA